MSSVFPGIHNQNQIQFQNSTGQYYTINTNTNALLDDLQPGIKQVE